MNALKIIIRIILVLLMIPVLVRLGLLVLSIISALSQKPDAMSYMMGQFVGTLLFLILFIWIFRKLGN